MNTGFIDRVIYDLKHRYPGTIVLHRDTEVIDARTLTKTVTKVTQVIKRAVILPEDAQRQFIARLANIVANREFSYGMFFDQGARTFLIDAKDLGSFGPPKETDYIVFDSARWEIQKITRFDFSAAYALSGKRVEGVPVNAHFEKRPRNRLVFGQSTVLQ